MKKENIIQTIVFISCVLLLVVLCFSIFKSAKSNINEKETTNTESVDSSVSTSDKPNSTDNNIETSDKPNNTDEDPNIVLSENLFSVNKYKSGLACSINTSKENISIYTNDDGEIFCRGMILHGFGFSRSIQEFNLEPGTYSLSSGNAKASDSTYQIILSFSDDAGNNYTYSDETFTILKPCTAVAMVHLPGDGKFDEGGVIFKPVLKKVA